MRAPAYLLFAFVASMTAATACSNQGEGELCDQKNGNNDCQDGLTCEAAPGVTSGVNTDRCCPTPPAQPTTAACSLATTTTIDAATDVPDVLTGGPDAPVEAASEAAALDSAGDVVSSDATADAVAPKPEAGPEAGADGAPE